MTLSYEIPEEKDNAARAVSVIRRACEFMERRDLKAEFSSEKHINDKYLCPCGIVDMRIYNTSDKGKPYPRTISILSHSCGI